MLYDPKNPLWEKVRIDVANQLVSTNAYVVARWVDALRPVALQLHDPIAAIFNDEKRGDSERVMAASALAEYVSDQPEALAETLMDATLAQFASIFGCVERHRVNVAPLLETELAKKPPSQKRQEPTDADNKAREKLYNRQANAAVALIRSGQTEELRKLSRHSPDPSLRSYLIHRLGPLGFEPGLLIALLDRETDASSRRAFILSLGEYGEGRLSINERNALKAKLLDLYRNDPDPGIHGAAEWLLRWWGNDDQLTGIDKDLGKLALPTLSPSRTSASSNENNRRWFVNSQGQTLVIVREPDEFEMGRDRASVENESGMASPSPVKRSPWSSSTGLCNRSVKPTLPGTTSVTVLCPLAQGTG